MLRSLFFSPVCRAPFAGCLCLAMGCDIRDEIARPTRLNPLLGSMTAAAGAAVEPAIEYVGGYEAGRQRAAAEDRPLFIVCTAGWCRFSAEMTQRTLRDARLVAASRRAVCVLLDADRDARICHALDVRAFPTLLVLDAGGAERFRSTGRATPDALAAVLVQALAPRRLAVAPEHEPAAR